MEVTQTHIHTHTCGDYTLSITLVPYAVSITLVDTEVCKIVYIQINTQK